MKISSKSKRKLNGAIATLMFIVAFVFVYAVIGGQVKSLQQVISILVAGLYLGALFLLQDCERTLGVWLVYVLTALVSLGAFVVLWSLNVEKSLIIGVALLVLSLTSRAWLRAI
jgi:hypothetical protein